MIKVTHEIENSGLVYTGNARILDVKKHTNLDIHVIIIARNTTEAKAKIEDYVQKEFPEINIDLILFTIEPTFVII